MKTKMPLDKKVRIIFLAEFCGIGLVFLILGILRLTGVMQYNETRRIVFNWITIFGGTWGIVDFVWVLVSKKRRKKNCVLDKVLNLIVGIYILIFDIFCFTNTITEPTMFNLLIGIAFIYMFLSLSFQGIYHYFKPTPMIKEAIEEELKEQEEKAKELENKEDGKDAQE